MTYRFAQLSAGRKFPEHRGIRWDKIALVVPCDENGAEISTPSLQEDMRLWNKQISRYEIKGNVMYVYLKGVQL